MIGTGRELQHRQLISKLPVNLLIYSLDKRPACLYSADTAFLNTDSCCTSPGYGARVAHADSPRR